MAEPMVFSAQHPSEMMVEEPGRDTNPETHYKRARSNHEEPTAMPPRGRVDSFKSKLIGATNPSTWLGFGTGKERITIGDSGIVLMEGPNGQEAMLSEELKSKLHKPWANALILKIMGITHSLNFMI
ncbi:hypothetical protein ACOSQ2_000017 [Xanthoceras sorbifolium]